MAARPQLPASSSTVRVRMFDTTTTMAVGAEFFVDPVRPGHEVFNLTTVGFLIEHETLGKKVLFDLGCRKDWWNSPPQMKSRLVRILKGLKVEENVSEIIEHAGLTLGSIGQY